MSGESHMPELKTFGHHPEADFDFAIEADALEGLSYEVNIGLASQWPFWGRLSRALREGRDHAWFGRPDLEPFLRNLERQTSAKSLGDGPRSTT